MLPQDQDIFNVEITVKAVFASALLCVSCCDYAGCSEGEVLLMMIINVIYVAMHVKGKRRKYRKWDSSVF